MIDITSNYIILINYIFTVEKWDDYRIVGSSLISNYLVLQRIHFIDRDPKVSALTQKSNMCT